MPILNKNIKISLCRVLATIMIVICHFGTAYNYSSIGQFFQSGVQVFIFLSGLLYGEKRIANSNTWLLSRWKRVSVPCYLHVLFLLLFCIIVNAPFFWQGVVLIFLNLEGYHHIITFIPNNWVVPGTGHFWFITMICLCYVIVSIIKRNNWDPTIKKYKKILLIALFIISLITGLLGIRTDYFFIFMMGYVFSSTKDTSPSNKQLIICSVIFVFSIALRLIGKWYCDIHGDNKIYLYVIIPLVYNAIAIAFYCFTTKLYEVFKDSLSERVLNIIVAFDELSFYVFLTHYMFIDGPLSLIKVTPYALINIVCIIISTIVFSLILKHISNSVIRLLKGKQV